MSLAVIRYSLPVRHGQHAEDMRKKALDIRSCIAPLSSHLPRRIRHDAASASLTLDHSAAAKRKSHLSALVPLYEVFPGRRILAPPAPSPPEHPGTDSCSGARGLAVQWPEEEPRELLDFPYVNSL